jgi:hypothetical protein
MIVIHFAKVSTLYPRVVISSLRGRLENLLFAILYTSFGVWPRDHYMSLQRSTTGVSHASLWFPRPWVPACSAKVSSGLKPLLHLVDQITLCIFPHTTEQDSQPTTSLISKQAIPYRTCRISYCPGVSTPKTWSLSDSSMTNLTS